MSNFHEPKIEVQPMPAMAFEASLEHPVDLQAVEYFRSQLVKGPPILYDIEDGGYQSKYVAAWSPDATRSYRAEYDPYKAEIRYTGTVNGFEETLTFFRPLDSEFDQDVVWARWSAPSEVKQAFDLPGENPHKLTLDQLALHPDYIFNIGAITAAQEHTSQRLRVLLPEFKEALERHAGSNENIGTRLAKTIGRVLLQGKRIIF